MDKSLIPHKPQSVTKWDNAYNACGSFGIEDGFFPIMPDFYRSGSSWNGSGSPDLLGGSYGYGGITERICAQHYYEAYRDCAPLQAIINKLAEAHANGVTFILNTQGKAKGKESESIQAKAIKKLLANPNPVQTQDEFEAQAKIYQKVFGFNVLFVLKPVGFENWDADELWNIPANLLDITLKQGNFIGRKQVIESIHLNYGTERILLPLENVYIQKDITPSFYTVALPESRIRALSPQVHNTLAAYSSRGAIIIDRGAGGIISSGGKDTIGNQTLSEEELQEVQIAAKRYGINRQQFRYIFSKVALNFQSMGFATKDLMLFEEIDDNIMRMCDAFGYPYQLLGSNKASNMTGSDTDHFNKILYQDNVLPDSRRDDAFWNTVFNTAAFGIAIENDFSHIPILQEDRVLLAKSRGEMNKAMLLQWMAGAVTLNEWRIAVEDDPIGEEQFDMYKPQYEKWLADNGFQPTGPIGLNPNSDLNQTENAGNGTGTKTGQ